MRTKIFLVIAALLAAVLAQSACADGVRVLIRYDDYANSSDPALERRLFDVVRSVGGRTLVGVIPCAGCPYSVHSPDPGDPVTNLSAEKVTLLRGYARDSVDVAVHGFAHRNNFAESEQSEFSGLPWESQVTLLGAAGAALRGALGRPVDAFIPPYNRYDTTTVEALAQTGYGIMSAGLIPRLEPGAEIDYLPGGPYPQRLRHAVMAALASQHRDALIVAVLHPYDFLESGDRIPEFRRGAWKMSLAQLEADLRAIRERDVEIVSLSQLRAIGEDLSTARARANSRLRTSLVSERRLLPQYWDLYPVGGNYYSQATANRLYWLQLGAAGVLYSSVFIFASVLASSLFGIAGERARRAQARGVAAAVMMTGALIWHGAANGVQIGGALALTVSTAALAGGLYRLAIDGRSRRGAAAAGLAAAEDATPAQVVSPSR